MLLQPGGEALVQLGPHRLRQRVVGRVPDEQVTEAEAILARQAAPCPGRISCLRTSAARRGVTWVSSGPSAWTAPRWKISPSIAPRSSTLRSAGSSWSRRAASSARNVGGTTTSPSVSWAIASISLDEERVATRRPSDPLAELLRDALAGSSSLDVFVAQGLEPERDRPGRAALDRAPAGPCRAAGSLRRRTGARRARSGRGTSPRPIGCRRRRPRAAALPPPAPASCGRPRRSPPRRSPLRVSPSRERIEAAAASSAGTTSSCFSTSTTGQ